MSFMPKLWTETIEAHRHAVRETVLDTAFRQEVDEILALELVIAVPEREPITAFDAAIIDLVQG